MGTTPGSMRSVGWGGAGSIAIPVLISENLLIFPSGRVPAESDLPHWERDMDLPNPLFRLQQDVNQLGVQQQQIVTFLGGNFSKVVQESLLQTLGDLQNR